MHHLLCTHPFLRPCPLFPSLIQRNQHTTSSRLCCCQGDAGDDADDEHDQAVITHTDDGTTLEPGCQQTRQRQQQLLGGVSSFGFGGTNAHVVLEGVTGAFGMGGTGRQAEVTRKTPTPGVAFLFTGQGCQVATSALFVCVVSCLLDCIRVAVQRPGAGRSPPVARR